MSQQNSVGRSLRRLAVRLIGQGPRSVHAPVVRAAKAHIIKQEHGATFPAPAIEKAMASTASQVSHWPVIAAHEPPRRAVIVNEAGLYDDDGVIYDLRTRAAFPETLDYWRTPPHRHLVFALPRVHPPQRLSGLSVFLGGLGGQTFYHFLVEILPKLALLAPVLPQADRLIIQDYIEPAKLAWLRHLGINLPVVWLHSLDHYQCDRLAFCPPVVSHYQPNPWTITTLHQLFSIPPTPALPRHRYLWADRRTAGVRAMAWERELVEQLPAPWEPVDFARLSPAETIALCAQCAGLAGLHGAGFANLALCPPGVRVLEIYTQPHETWYPCLSLSAGHHHEIAFADSAAAIPELIRRLTHLSPPAPPERILPS